MLEHFELKASATSCYPNCHKNENENTLFRTFKQTPTVPFVCVLVLYFANVYTIKSHVECCPLHI